MGRQRHPKLLEEALETEELEVEWPRVAKPDRAVPAQCARADPHRELDGRHCSDRADPPDGDLLRWRVGQVDARHVNQLASGPGPQRPTEARRRRPVYLELLPGADIHGARHACGRAGPGRPVPCRVRAAKIPNELVIEVFYPAPPEFAVHALEGGGEHVVEGGAGGVDGVRTPATTLTAREGVSPLLSPSTATGLPAQATALTSLGSNLTATGPLRARACLPRTDHIGPWTSPRPTRSIGWLANGWRTRAQQSSATCRVQSARQEAYGDPTPALPGRPQPGVGLPSTPASCLPVSDLAGI